MVDGFLNQERGHQGLAVFRCWNKEPQKNTRILANMPCTWDDISPFVL